MRKTILFLGFGVLIAAGLFAYKMLRPLAVQTAVLAEGTAMEVVYGSARVEAKTRASIKSRVSGTVREISVEVGQVVEPDALVLSLDAPQIREDILKSKADLLAASRRFSEKPQLRVLRKTARAIEAELHQAKLDLARLEKLLQSDASTQYEAERARIRVKTLESERGANFSQQRDVEIGIGTELQKQKATVASFQSRLLDLNIRAPIQGTVLWEGVKLGDVVLANQEIARIGDLRHLWMEALVDEADVPRVKVGMEAWVRLNGYPERVFEARVVRVVPEVQQATKSVEIDLDFSKEISPKELGMLAGMNGEVHILSKKKEGVLLIPLEAIDMKSVWIEREGTLTKVTNFKGTKDPSLHQFSVWTVEQGKLKEHAVKIGIKGTKEAEVISGLDKKVHVALLKEGVVFQEGQSVSETVLPSDERT